MFKLTDRVQITITITVFLTLVFMISCILYKLRKLREVMEEDDNDLGSLGLPRIKRNSVVGSSIAEDSLPCIACKEECLFKSHPAQSQQPNNHNVFTGELQMTVQYDNTNETLYINKVVAQDIYPWVYSSDIQTYLLLELNNADDRLEHVKSSCGLGLHRVCYEPDFNFELAREDLNDGILGISVWARNEPTKPDEIVGECGVLLKNLDLSSGNETVISEKLFHNAVRSADTKILLSLSYLPTAERLSVVVMKVKNVELSREASITRNQTTVPNPYVKVCLIYAGKKIKKKKTSVKKGEKDPVYNESMIFDVPGNFLHRIGFLITIEHRNFSNEDYTVLGRVVMGSPVHNESLRHWNQMLAYPRRPVAAWHDVVRLG